MTNCFVVISFKSAKPLVIGVDTDQYAERSAGCNCIRLRAASGSAIAQSITRSPLMENSRRDFSIHQTESIRRWSEDELLLVESVAVATSDGYCSGGTVLKWSPTSQERMGINF